MKAIRGRDDHSPEATEKVLPQFWKFIDSYGYRDVRKFVSRYQVVAFSEFKRLINRNDFIRSHPAGMPVDFINREWGSSLMSKTLDDFSRGPGEEWSRLGSSDKSRRGRHRDLPGGIPHRRNQ
jgi:hypothetical protein